MQRRQQRHHWAVFTTQSARAAYLRQRRTPRAPAFKRAVIYAQRPEPARLLRLTSSFGHDRLIVFFGSAAAAGETEQPPADEANPGNPTIHPHRQNTTHATPARGYWNLARPSSLRCRLHSVTLHLAVGEPESIPPSHSACPPHPLPLYPLSASLDPSYARALGGLIKSGTQGGRREAFRGRGVVAPSAWRGWAEAPPCRRMLRE